MLTNWFQLGFMSIKIFVIFQLQIGGKAVEAIKRRYGSEYKCQNSNSDGMIVNAYLNKNQKCSLI